MHFELILRPWLNVSTFAQLFQNYLLLLLFDATVNGVSKLESSMPTRRYIFVQKRQFQTCQVDSTHWKAEKLIKEATMRLWRFGKKTFRVVVGIEGRDWARQLNSNMNDRLQQLLPYNITLYFNPQSLWHNMNVKLVLDDNSEPAESFRCSINRFVRLRIKFQKVPPQNEFVVLTSS